MNTANGVVVFEGSPIRYKIACFSTQMKLSLEIYRPFLLVSKIIRHFVLRHGLLVLTVYDTYFYLMAFAFLYLSPGCIWHKILF